MPGSGTSVFLMVFFFLDFDTKSKDNKSKNKQAGLHQPKKYLQSEENCQQNENL